MLLGDPVLLAWREAIALIRVHVANLDHGLPAHHGKTVDSLPLGTGGKVAETETLIRVLLWPHAASPSAYTSVFWRHWPEKHVYRPHLSSLQS